MKKGLMLMMCLFLVIPSLMFASGDKESSSSKQQTVNVVYKEVEGYDHWLNDAKTRFEAANPGITVNLNKMPSTEADYNTKTALMLQTDSSVDVMVVDSFLVPSLVAGDNLASIPVEQWEDWETQFSSSIREGMTLGGNVYALPYSTDTRGLYYNVEVFQQAGIKTPWNPQSWNDVLAAIAQLQKAGIDYPLWMNASKAQGEATTMQTFEMILGGTDDWLYENGKWVVSSPGMSAALGFLEKIQTMGIYSNSDLAVMLDANSYRVLNEKFPLTKEVGIVLDGNWKGTDWINALGDSATDVIAITPMPNENGDGFSSMSGGWTLGISPLSEKQDIAFDFIQTAVDKEGSLALVNTTGDMAVRKDVVSEPDYIAFNPYRAIMSSFTEFTKFRPGVDAYPSVSIEIQSAVESVVSGQMTAAEAASVYARNVKSIVGDGNWIEK